MTRKEEKELQKALNHKEYVRNRAHRLEYASRYAKEHREHINEMARKRRAKAKIKAMEVETYIPPSIDSIEEMMPYFLKKNKAALRAEFLSIHITKRPTYDFFLRCKTIEYIYDKRRRNTGGDTSTAIT